jgi:hypothetical protein
LKVIRRSEPKDCSTKKGTPFRSMEKWSWVTRAGALYWSPLNDVLPIWYTTTPSS